MSKALKILMADSVREKQRIWSQINITKFAEKMHASKTLKSEECCDTLHQEKRRNGTEARQHPKRTLRAFIYYVVYVHKITYDDEAGAAVPIHDLGEDVSLIILIGGEYRYGNQTTHYALVLSKDENETIEESHDRIVSIDVTIMIKLCDCLDNLLEMLEEYYQGLPSATRDRLSKYLDKKIRPFIKKVEDVNLENSKYKNAIMDALSDLRLVVAEAQSVV